MANKLFTALLNLALIKTLTCCYSDVVIHCCYSDVVIHCCYSDVEIHCYLVHATTELTSTLGERDVLSSRCEHLQRRTEAVLSDFEQEKKEKFDAKVIFST